MKGECFMQIPLNASSHPKRPSLELCKISLYSTGARGKVFTNHFYKAMNHNFGVEMVIRNNTSTIQTIKIAGCIYDAQGNTILNWRAIKQISALSLITQDFYVRQETFSQLKEGKYKIQFWINGKKIQKDFFTITFK